MLYKLLWFGVSWHSTEKHSNNHIHIATKLLILHVIKIILFDFPLSLASFLCFRRCSLTCKEKSCKWGVLSFQSLNTRSLFIRSTIELCFCPKDKRISCSIRYRVTVSLIDPDCGCSCTIKLKLNFPNYFTRTFKLILRL